VRPHGIGLEHHADVALARAHQQVALGLRHDATADRDAAAGRMLEAGDTAERRGLAAARGAQQHDDLAGRHVEVHPVHGGFARREPLDEVLDEKRGAHWR